MTLSFCRVEQISFRPNVAFQRHDDFFPRTVDGGVGHLSEQLLEIVIDQPRLVAHAGQCRIITHRPDRVFLGGDHRNEHELQCFRCVAERLHVREQFFANHSVRRFGSG